MIFRKSLTIVLVFQLLASAGLSQSPAPQQGATPCRAENATLPSSASAKGEIRFAAVGDTGRGCDEKAPLNSPQCRVSAQIVAAQKKTGLDMLLLLGDNVYESGKPKHFFERLYEPYRSLHTAGVLIKGVVGNHDVRNAEGTAIQMRFFESRDVADQAKFFTMPVDDQVRLPGGSPTYYSFKRGNDLVEFFAVDSSMLTDDCCGPFSGKEYPAAEKQKQLDWLRGGLKASSARWKIVLLHHPLYSSSKEHGAKVARDGTIELDSEMQKIRQIEPILAENGVRLVLTAHDHVYERIKLQKGVQYLVSGGGSDTRASDFERRMPDFHLCGESRKSSFTLLSVGRDKIDFWAIDETGQIFDSGSVSPD